MASDPLKLGITDSFEPLSGYLESNPGPWQEQQILLTVEPFLHSPPPIFNSLVGLNFFQVRFSLHIFCCPGTHSVDQAGLELTEICLPLPPECWN